GSPPRNTAAECSAAGGHHRRARISHPGAISQAGGDAVPAGATVLAITGRQHSNGAPRKCAKEAAFTLNYFFSGSANTYSAFPYCGYFTSGARIPGTMRGLPPPRPDDTAMNCRPPAVNVRGKPCTEVPRRVSHSTRPFRTSTARKVRFMSPTKARPPAVDRTAV